MPPGMPHADVAVVTTLSKKAPYRARSAGWTIRNRLTLIVFAVAIPFLLMSAGIIWQVGEHERANRREAILFSARMLINAVDAMISKRVAIAQMLAASPALRADDLVTFRQEAERALPALSGGWIVIGDPDGQQLLNLSRPAGTKLPHRNPKALETQRRAFETGQFQVSDVFAGAVLGSPIVTVEVPVIREGAPPLGLAVIMEPKIFLALLDDNDLPEGWLAGLIDRKGNFIARSRDHDGTVGKSASEGFRTTAQRSNEGWNEFASLDGDIVANAHVVSPLSGWTIGLAASKDEFEAPIRRTILLASLAGLCTTLISVLLALWAARRIATSIEQIEQGSHALLRREPLAFPSTGVPEVDRALDAFSHTAEAFTEHEKERDEREAHIHLIMRELSHRSKNLLAIILAIARRTARQTTNFKDFEGRFTARVQALATAHDLLIERQWRGASLPDLVRSQIGAFGLERVTCSDDPILLRPEAVQNVGLALHELATNAAKYGALSTTGGRIDLHWTFVGSDPDDRVLRLTWRESGGPPVTPPARKGFGSFVLEQTAPSMLGGPAALQFEPTGIVWTCDIAARFVTGLTGAAVVSGDRSHEPARIADGVAQHTP